MEIKFNTHTVLIDDEDSHFLTEYTWHITPQGRTHNLVAHVYRDGKRTTQTLHRLVMNAPKGLLVDHADGNGLNNTRANLRLADYVQNGRNRRVGVNNTSGFKGVTYHAKRPRSPYRADIQAQGKSRTIGHFQTATDAALAYDAAALASFGEFACTNASMGFLPCQPTSSNSPTTS